MRHFLNIAFIFSHLLLHGQWTSLNGPSGGDIRKLFELSDGSLYASNHEYIFTKPQHSEVWTREESNFQNFQALCYLESPDGDIYIGFSTDGNSPTLYGKKPDGAWEPIPIAGTEAVRAMVINNRGELIIGYGRDVKISPDGGKTSYQVRVGNNLNTVYLVNHPSGALLAGTTRGLYISEDHGQSWEVIKEGIPEDIRVFELEISKDGQTVFVDGDNRVYIRKDMNEPFKVLPDTIPDYISAFAFDTLSKLYLATTSGLVYQFDSTLQEKKVVFKTPTEKILIYDLLFSQQNRLIIASNGEGIWQETTPGNFERDHLGLTATNITSQVVIDDHLIVSTKNYMFLRREDQWYDLLIDSLPFSSRNMLQFNSQLIAATSQGVKSIDLSGPDRYSSTNLGLDTLNIIFLYRDQINRLYAGTWREGLFRRSEDLSWIDISNDEMRSSTITSITSYDQDVLVAGTNRGIFHTTNGGGSWIRAAQTPPVTQIITTRAGTALAVAYPGVLRSTDQGLNWQSIEVSPVWETRSILENIDGTLYVSTNRDGIFRSTDDGVSWQRYSEGLVNGSVHCLTKNQNGDVFAGTNGGGVYILPHGTVATHNQNPHSFPIRVYPNPASRELYLQSDGIAELRGTSRILSPQGIEISHKNFNLLPGNSVEWDISQLTPGPYFITFETDRTRQLYKVLVLP